MPEWNSANGHDGKYIPLADANAGASDGDVALDLWHWRGARSNPIAMADDQNILTLDWANVPKTSGDDGGRKGDAGQSVFFNQGITGGDPDYLLDPTTTWGDFIFDWYDFWLTPFFYMTLDNAGMLGPMAPNPLALAWADVTGFSPIEGDTVPRRILRAGAGSRADITAFGTVYRPSTLDESLGTWHVQMQRLRNTTNPDDIALVAGQQYDVGFEVHLWEYTTRDHYVSFPLTLGVGNAAPASDIVATDISSTTPTGTYPLPDWGSLPTERVWLFQPGINTWEFLQGLDGAKVYTDPVTGNPVDQNHGGAAAVAGGTTPCVTCHAVREVDLTGGQFGGSMENITKQRGGIWADTPVD